MPWCLVTFLDAFLCLLGSVFIWGRWFLCAVLYICFILNKHFHVNVLFAACLFPPFSVLWSHLLYCPIFFYLFSSSYTFCLPTPWQRAFFLLFEIPFISDPFHRLWRVSTVVNVEENVYCLFIFFKGMYICVTKLWVILPPDHHGISIFFFLSWILFFFAIWANRKAKKNIYFSLQFTVHIEI